MIPLKPFYLIRHGETEANTQHLTAGGAFDTKLTARGIAQATALSKVIHNLEARPQKILHSCMSRARDTATIINNALSLVLHELDDLTEHLTGEWDGRPWAEVEELLHADIKPEGGENKTEFRERVQRVFTEILETHDELVMIVAHGGIFHALTNMYEHESGPIDNCHLHYFEPCHEYDPFPWRVWHFDIEQDRLAKKPAMFCGSTLLKDIA